MIKTLMIALQKLPTISIAGKAPEVETIESINFYANKLVELSGNEIPFAMILDITEHKEELPNDIRKILFDRLTSADLNISYFAVVSNKGRLINRVAEKMMSHLLGFRIRFFASFPDALLYCNGKGYVGAIAKMRYQIKEFFLYLDLNNDTNPEKAKRFVKNWLIWLLPPLLFLMFIVLPLRYHLSYKTLWFHPNFQIAMIPVIALALTFFLMDKVDFVITRIILPSSFAIAGGFIIATPEIVHQSSYVLTYLGTIALFMAWYMLSLRQFLLIAFMTIASLVIGNYIGGLYSIQELLQMFIIFVVLIPFAYLGLLSTNITESELILRQDLAQHEYRLRQIGELSASIAHEVNNPLTIIAGASIRLKNQLLKLEEEYPEHSESIQSNLSWVEKQLVATKRIENIVRGLRGFGRKVKHEKNSFNIFDVVDETYKMIVDLFAEKGVKLTLSNGSQVRDTHVFGNRDSIIQAITNLLTNASDATETQEERVVNINYALIENKKVSIAVRDNGPGIPQKIQEKMFELFYSTKSTDRGGGMGLGITKKIIIEHEGQLTFYTSSKGTTFTITLPIAESS